MQRGPPSALTSPESPLRVCPGPCWKWISVDSKTDWMWGSGFFLTAGFVGAGPHELCWPLSPRPSAPGPPPVLGLGRPLRPRPGQLGCRPALVAAAGGCSAPRCPRPARGSPPPGASLPDTSCCPCPQGPESEAGVLPHPPLPCLQAQTAPPLCRPGLLASWVPFARLLLWGLAGSPLRGRSVRQSGWLCFLTGRCLIGQERYVSWKPRSSESPGKASADLASVGS